ncbi:MAG: aminotransferase class III-fold pyridoxal phosphate-dependent enzyme [Firmicutes bacterium]|nr:aminotransferase class III-fold pyridoxal phosphate-dependent enzyme [Bacillota bacterium]
MDKSFVRGEGCYLYDSEGRRYVDLIASYGALPFGFNPPAIWDAILAVRDTLEPSFVQPSYLNAAGELARRLASVAPGGLSRVTFTNSGAEAVEAAIKACRAATGRLRILAARNSFHGKTLGALSATGREAYQKVFGAPVEGFDFVPYGDAQAIEGVFKSRGGEYAAVILEPIQGEGGIVTPPAGFLKEVRELCDRYEVPLVLDEIQTGLGRTGRLFACEEEGVVPDVMLLAKALGGGIVPIGAVLCSERVYTEEFAMKHSSTFAGNTLACRAGIAALDLLTAGECALIKQVKANGAVLKEGLEDVQRRYPHALRSIRGRGFMLGLEFGITRDTFTGGLLGVMAEQELLTPVVSSYLLNIEGLRVAPTLNGADVIRIEPPLIMSESQCREAIEGIGRAVSVLASGNTARLLSHLVAGAGRGSGAVTGAAGRGGERVAPAAPSPHIEPGPSGDPQEGRFAFLLHPLTLRNYPEFDESLSAFSEPELGELAERWNDLVEPFVLSRARVVSKTGASAYGEFIAVPRTTEQLLERSRDDVLGIIKRAVELARANGARVVGLGAYTSIGSRGGRDLLGEGVAVTTGNSYTVVSAVEAVARSLERLGVDPLDTTMCVVGATGSIGRATAILLSEFAPRLALVGNPRWPDRSRRRLLEVGAGACRHLSGQIRKGRVFSRGSIGDWIQARGIPAEDCAAGDYAAIAAGLERDGLLTVTTDSDRCVAMSDVVVTATSTLATLVTPGNVKSGAVVCDLSRPPNVSREISESRPDVLVIDGGVVALPGLPSLGWNFGFEQGLAYACMAETIMLALEHHYEHTSIGLDLDIDRVTFMRELAAKHGFGLADLRSFDRPLSPAEWEKVVAARRRGGLAGEFVTRVTAG